MMLSWSAVTMLNEAPSTDLHRGIIEAQCPASTPDIATRRAFVMCPSAWVARPRQGPLGQAAVVGGKTACLLKRLWLRDMKSSWSLPVLANARQCMDRRCGPGSSTNQCWLGCKTCGGRSANRGGSLPLPPCSFEAGLVSRKNATHGGSAAFINHVCPTTGF